MNAKEYIKEHSYKGWSPNDARFIAELMEEYAKLKLEESEGELIAN